MRKSHFSREDKSLEQQSQDAIPMKGAASTMRPSMSVENLRLNSSCFLQLTLSPIAHHLLISSRSDSATSPPRPIDLAKTAQRSEPAKRRCNTSTSVSHIGHDGKPRSSPTPPAGCRLNSQNNGPKARAKADRLSRNLPSADLCQHEVAFSATWQPADPVLIFAPPLLLRALPSFFCLHCVGLVTRSLTFVCYTYAYILIPLRHPVHYCYML